MAWNIRKAFWVVAGLWLITARDCCITSVGQTVQSSLEWVTEVNPSAESRRAGPVCSCTLLTEPCSLYVLHDFPEPYCPLYTRYCCDLELLAAILPPASQSQRGNTSTLPAAQAGKSKAQRALESCGCTSYLLPCPVHIYENNLVLSGWFECQYFHRYCCGAGVLADVLLPYVDSPEHQQQEETATAGEDEQQRPQGEPLRDAAAEGASWWAWVTG
ncbi:hypothetical protein E2C01_026980 [Portunus trituberculatus]|uniref:Uncharacterized protein n=1 Tax=Portunus trituberculatus TaxID=210409 RepID=A0A5B7EJP4_PORTR|nr:hypothetical protein [Portunus trituberculatus]